VGATLHSVKKTSIYLEPELDIELARVAHARGVAKAELIRGTLRRVVEENPQPRITAIGVDRDPVPADLSPEDREIAEILQREHDTL
jgi:hypothetical protein